MHEVTLTKNLHEDVADSNAVHGDNNLVTQPQREIAKVLRNYVNTKDNKDKNTKPEQYMNKKLIRLTENDLHRIVKESVNKILKEYSYDYMNKEYYCLEKLYLEFGKIHKESKYTNDDGINGGKDIHNAYLNLDENSSIFLEFLENMVKTTKVVDM